MPVLSTVNSRYSRTKVLKPVQKFTNPMKNRKPLEPHTGSTTLASTSTPMRLNSSCKHCNSQVQGQLGVCVFEKLDTHPEDVFLNNSSCEYVPYAWDGPATAGVDDIIVTTGMH